MGLVAHLSNQGLLSIKVNHIPGDGPLNARVPCELFWLCHPLVNMIKEAPASVSEAGKAAFSSSRGATALELEEHQFRCAYAADQQVPKASAANGR